MTRWMAALAVAALCLGGCERGGGENAALGSYPDGKLKELKPGNRGVVLAWRKGSPPKEGQPNAIAIGQTLVVRVRNLDGWLIAKLIDNRVTGEPDMTSAQRNNYALLDKLSKDNGGALAVLKRYEAAEQPALAPSPTPGEGTAAAPEPPLEPLPAGVKPKDLRAAFNAYEGLLNTVKRQLFLVLNNSQFRQLKAENPDARVANAEAKANGGDTIHQFEFRMRRRPGDEEAWSSLYDGTKAVHEVRVSLGVELDGRVFVLETGVYPQSPDPVQHVTAQFIQLVLARLDSVLAGRLALRFSLPRRDHAAPARSGFADAGRRLPAVQPLAFAARFLDFSRRRRVPRHLAGDRSARYFEHDRARPARDQLRDDLRLETGQHTHPAGRPDADRAGARGAARGDGRGVAGAAARGVEGVDGEGRDTGARAASYESGGDRSDQHGRAHRALAGRSRIPGETPIRPLPHRSAIR